MFCGKNMVPSELLPCFRKIQEQLNELRAQGGWGKIIRQSKANKIIFKCF